MKVDRTKVLLAISNAARKHGTNPEVAEMLKNRESYADDVVSSIEDGSYINRLQYRSLTKVNPNGKRRNINSPSLYTRVLQHVFLVLIMPIYKKLDPGIGMNCKDGYGINSSIKNNSVMHKVKKLMYDKRNLHYSLIVDQRRCYDHVTRKIFRQSLKKIVKDKELVDFGVEVTFCGNTFPIGTPTSPVAHHIICLGFDRWLGGVAPFKVRYADDCLLAFETKEEANEAKWRIQNYWWYEIGIRAKTTTCRIQNIDKEALSYCGFVVRRNPEKVINDHDKGYCTVKQGIKHRANHCSKNESWAAYFGIFARTDSYTTMKSIEERMKLSELTKKIKIDREMDAKNISPKDLLGVKFTIYDYDLRKDKNGTANWIKFLIGIPDEKTGKILAREFHGGYSFLVDFIARAEKLVGKENLLPMEDVEIESQSGFIFKDSKNQMEFIDDLK